MVRLIVEDAGGRRAFRVGEGRLSVGSGAEAKLALAAPGVARLHAELEVRGGKAVLHVKSGVAAPLLTGRAASGPVELQHGVPVRLGGATLTVEYEGSPAKLSPQRSASPERSASTDRRRPSGRAPREHRAPAWVWRAVGLAGIAVAGSLVAAGWLGKGARLGEAGAWSRYTRALDRFEDAQYAAALADLDSIPQSAALDASLAARVAKLREQLQAKLAETSVDSRSELAGQVYFAAQLESFVREHLSGEIRAPEARVFLKRARVFRERWPKHPDLPWVASQEARFAAALDLAEPPTFADIEFEVQSLTWSHPRDYAEAFAVARAFQATAAGADAAKLARFLAELEIERAEWFQERLEQARRHFEDKEIGSSLGVLLEVVRGAGDNVMADDAAGRFLEYGSAEEMATWLRRYRASEPELYARVAENRVIAAFLREREP